MAFSDPVRKRARTLQTLVGYAMTPQLHPKARPVRTYWWAGHPNFGDELSSMLLPRYGIAPLLKPRNTAELFAVGSVIELIPADFTGWVWGSGKMHEHEVTTLPDAKILAVRGRLTRDLLQAPASTPLGDPGLLVSKWVRRRRPAGRIAIIPHFTHRDLPEVQQLTERLGLAAYVVDVRKSARQVVAEVSAASAVVSTSLHGIIVADAYGIPATWALPEPVLAGGTFKFRDYQSAVLDNPASRRCSLDALRSTHDVDRVVQAVAAERVAELQRELIDALAPIRVDRTDMLSPFALPARQFRQ